MMLETSAAQAQADRTRFTELRWMTAEGHWNHLVYDPSEEIMVVDPQKRPRPRAEVLKELERLIIIFKTPELILKYDSFRPLKGKLEGPLMTFQLELSLQSPVAHEAMQILRGWFGRAPASSRSEQSGHIWHRLCSKLCADERPRHGCRSPFGALRSPCLGGSADTQTSKSL